MSKSKYKLDHNMILKNDRLVECPEKEWIHCTSICKKMRGAISDKEKFSVVSKCISSKTTTAT
jgi:hypothetical protein